MNLIDLAGPPGVGKSTLIDALAWRGAVTRGALRALTPCDTDTSFVHACGGGPDWRAVAVASLRRAAGVRALDHDGVAADDHGPCQRGLDLVRCADFDAVRDYFETMPLPERAFFCVADVEVVQQRNRDRAARTSKPDTSDEAWTWLEASWVAFVILKRRGATVGALDMALPVEVNANRLMAEC